LSLDGGGRVISSYVSGGGSSSFAPPNNTKKSASSPPPSRRNAAESALALPLSACLLFVVRALGVPNRWSSTTRCEYGDGGCDALDGVGMGSWARGSYAVCAIEDVFICSTAVSIVAAVVPAHVIEILPRSSTQTASCVM
jgi:hypothetical protein